MVAGLMAGIAGLLFAARTNAGDPTAGTSYELTAITATVLGGTNLFGGYHGELNLNGHGPTMYAVIVDPSIETEVDQGADPNSLVVITDQLSATTLPAGESFTTLKTARSGEVLRGVSFTPGS